MARSVFKTAEAGATRPVGSIPTLSRHHFRRFMIRNTSARRFDFERVLASLLLCSVILAVGSCAGSATARMARPLISSSKRAAYSPPHLAVSAVRNSNLTRGERNVINAALNASKPQDRGRLYYALPGGVLLLFYADYPKNITPAGTDACSRGDLEDCRVGVLVVGTTGRIYYPARAGARSIRRYPNECLSRRPPWARGRGGSSRIPSESLNSTVG